MGLLDDVLTQSPKNGLLNLALNLAQQGGQNAGTVPGIAGAIQATQQNNTDYTKVRRAEDQESFAKTLQEPWLAQLAGVGGSEAVQKGLLEQMRSEFGHDRSPYYQYIQAANGIYRFNARTGEVDFAPGQSGDGGGVKGVLTPKTDPGLERTMHDAAATGTATGTATGGAITNLADLESNYPTLVQNVNELRELGKTATYTMAGKAWNAVKRETGFGATPGGIARTAYENKVRTTILPLLRTTFGAQFTEPEGRRLETTLGDPDKTPEEKDAALTAYMDAEYRKIQTAKRRVGADPGAGDAATPPPAPSAAAPVGGGIGTPKSGSVIGPVKDPARFPEGTRKAWNKIPIIVKNGQWVFE